MLLVQLNEGLDLWMDQTGGFTSRWTAEPKRMCPNKVLGGVYTGFRQSIEDA